MTTGLCEASSERRQEATSKYPERVADEFLMDLQEDPFSNPPHDWSCCSAARKRSLARTKDMEPCFASHPLNSGDHRRLC